jgi:hypothetical protein
MVKPGEIQNQCFLSRTSPNSGSYVSRVTSLVVFLHRCPNCGSYLSFSPFNGHSLTPRLSPSRNGKQSNAFPTRPKTPVPSSSSLQPLPRDHQTDQNSLSAAETRRAGATQRGEEADGEVVLIAVSSPGGSVGDAPSPGEARRGGRLWFSRGTAQKW